MRAGHIKQIRLPMVAPVRPRIVSTEETKGKDNPWFTMLSSRTAAIFSQGFKENKRKKYTEYKR